MTNATPVQAHPSPTLSARDSATAVLLRNWRGSYTVPAGGLYPHQWSWDSAFIAIGWRHISVIRAQQELDSLFSAQWRDGRLPQIVFNPRRDSDYSPGPSFWGPVHLASGCEVPTSGLIQPPNHALAALLVHRSDTDTSRRRGFLERAYPRLVAWHDYLRDRRATSSGLVYVMHPWESGMDNSPYWDEPLARIDGLEGDIPRPDLDHAAASDRPSTAEYAKYLYLASRYRDSACEDSVESSPFRAVDPAVNALFVRSELALAEIATEIGQDATIHRDHAAALTTAFEDLWLDELGSYVALDDVTGRLQPFRTVSGLIPLLAPGIRHATELLATLRGPSFALGSAAMVPSLDLTSDLFDSARYWRGPSWFNTAWLIATALRERGLIDEYDVLTAQMAELAVASDFAEYVSPDTGHSRGTQRFSWTAALTLDVMTP